ncbi:hypothetical protein COC69_17195 [Bacillus cereus]|uniref:Uncharacterized protein n=1 Tax=Bacillus cereus TaxID=1396 RepID=A0A9X7GV92_BACCE|nr:hypothetical protein [Bacillus cereus]PGS78014.1 hypothetical protein COC69_17195 [Bacillus cereus]
MKHSNQKLNIKKITGIALVSAIGFTSLGALGTKTSSVYAAEPTYDIAATQTIKAEDMSIKQLQDAIQQKNDPFINQVKIFIDKHFQKSELLWEKVSKQLKIDLIDLLLGNEKDYSKKIDDALAKHVKEVPTLLDVASLEFIKDLILLLDYLPE